MSLKLNNLFHKNSYKQGVLISVGYTFIAKAIGFLNSAVVAYYFGTKVQTDIFFYMLSTVGLVLGLISTLNGAVLVPEMMRLREKISQKESQEFANFFLYLYLLFGTVIAIVFFVNPILFLQTISCFNKNSLIENIVLVKLFTPVFILFIINTLLIDIMSAYKYFTLPMLINVLNSSLSLIFIVVFHKYWDVISMVLALNLGYLIATVILIILIKQNLNWSFRFRYIKLSKKTWTDAIYAQAGNITSIIAAYSPLWLLSSFGAGTISSLTYGKSTSEIPDQFLTSKVSQIMGIKINELHAMEKFKELNIILMNTYKSLLLIIVPLSGIMFLYSNNIISLLFKRGKFDYHSVAVASEVLKYFALVLPFSASDTVFARLFMASQRIKQSFLFQVVLNVVFIAALFYLIKTFGIIGYPLAALLKIIVAFSTIGILINKYFKYIKYSNFFWYFLFVLFVNAIVFLVVYYIQNKYKLVENVYMFAGGVIYITTVITILISFDRKYREYLKSSLINGIHLKNLKVH
jgi:peptidoglycan biosynthesis protein MviN/MurJ (putative lipid II flippase)